MIDWILEGSCTGLEASRVSLETWTFTWPCVDSLNLKPQSRHSQRCTLPYLFSRRPSRQTLSEPHCGQRLESWCERLGLTDFPLLTRFCRVAPLGACGRPSLSPAAIVASSLLPWHAITRTAQVQLAPDFNRLLAQRCRDAIPASCVYQLVIY